MRRIFIAALVGAALVQSIDLGACGDKFLRVGRSARFRRYAAVHPATILIYAPASSTRAGIDELTLFLKRAGHKAVALDRNASISAALAASPYDVLIGDYVDAVRMNGDLRSAASHAALLPIVNTSTKDVEAQALREYGFVIKPHAMTKYDALAEIDRLMESRGRQASRGRYRDD